MTLLCEPHQCHHHTIMCISTDMPGNTRLAICQAQSKTWLLSSGSISIYTSPPLLPASPPHDTGILLLCSPAPGSLTILGFSPLLSSICLPHEHGGSPPLLSSICLPHDTRIVVGKIWHPNVCDGAAKGEHADDWTTPYYHAPCISLGSIYNHSCYEEYPGPLPEGPGGKVTSVYSNSTPGSDQDMPDGMIAQHAVDTLRSLKTSEKPFFMAVGTHIGWCKHS